jgi:hypothetical protein
MIFSTLNFDKMQNIYNIVKVMLIFVLLFTQKNLQAQKCCVDCQSDLKIITNKRVLLEKIYLKVGTTSSDVHTNLYVSYRSGNAQKFWGNLAIATAGVAVSTQLKNSNPSEGNGTNNISPIIPLSVSMATLPGIWKNRPRAVPEASLLIQHKDADGKVLDTWTQAISKFAKNDAELLSVTIEKSLKKGSLEVYLQNNSKNSVYYWGYETNSKRKQNNDILFESLPVSLSVVSSCPNGFLPNGNGRCFSPFTGQQVNETCPDGFEATADVDAGGHVICITSGGTVLPGVTVTAPPYVPPYTPTPTTPLPTNPWGTPGPNGDGGYSGGGGGNNGSTPDPATIPNDSPEAKTAFLNYDVLTTPFSIKVVSYDKAELSRPNSRSRWLFDDLRHTKVKVEGGIIGEKWDAEDLDNSPSVGGAKAFMTLRYVLTRTSLITALIGGDTTETKTTFYNYDAF